jgi:hypothetical protein
LLLYWSGLQSDAGDKELLLEGAQKLKHDAAIVLLKPIHVNFFSQMLPDGSHLSEVYFFLLLLYQFPKLCL